ncbi:hypothetical protein N005_01840 [Pseudomonas mediterranea CFBP 5447]|nr:hypothetical protein N005_01840 [Pseudomonas mediterranea CFBP 5447]
MNSSVQQYNCRHTYATMWLMAGMNPAFIATQLGLSVQMLLSTYARWINPSADWGRTRAARKQLDWYKIGTDRTSTLLKPLWNQPL